MPHPHLSRTSARRTAALALIGAATLLPTGALAQALPGLGAADLTACEVLDGVLSPAPTADAVDATCTTPEGIPGDAVIDPAGAVTDAATGPAAPAVAEVVSPIPDVPHVPDVPDAPAVVSQVVAAIVPEGGGATSGTDAVAPTPPGATTSEAATTDPAATTEVKAAGSNVDEVLEPAAPAADGRVDMRVALAPDLSGTNLPRMNSQSVTLQPYEAPMVSTPAPTVFTPEVATTGPVSIVSPLQEAATAIANLTGSAMLPYTTGAGAWITATGLGLLGASAVAWRRRSGELDETAVRA